MACLTVRTTQWGKITELEVEGKIRKREAVEILRTALAEVPEPDRNIFLNLRAVRKIDSELVPDIKTMVNEAKVKGKIIKTSLSRRITDSGLLSALWDSFGEQVYEDIHSATQAFLAEGALR